MTKNQLHFSGIKSLRILAFSMPRIWTMGNACPSLKSPGSSPAKMSIPRNLEELLEDLDTIDIDDVTATIEAHTVTKAFRDYLRSRQLQDEETALKFLVLVQALIGCDRQLKQPKLSGGKRTSLQQRQELIFRKAVAQFFAEDGEEQVSLSNEVLFNELASAASLEAVTDQHLEYLRKARKDSSVWSELLEPTYLKFLKQYNPSINIAACLLSIL